MKHLDKIAKEIFKEKIVNTGEFDKIRPRFINLRPDSIKTKEGKNVAIRILKLASKNIKNRGANHDDMLTVMKIKSVESAVYGNIRCKKERVYLTEQIVKQMHKQLISDIKILIYGLRN